jgi:sugar phosphate isomerase/epimerase
MPHRRTFLKTTLLLSSLDSIAAITQPQFMSLNKDFKLLILATNWGFEGSLEQYLQKVKEERYDGIEIWWPANEQEQANLFALLKKYNLQVGFLCGGHQTDFEAHLASFKGAVTAAATNKVQRPLYINCHSGKDYFTAAQNQSFIDHTNAVAAQTGILICHETHRSRMLYSAPLTRQFLEANKDLYLTADFSHWCNVHESLLQDQPETMQLAISRTRHIHARIGHAEGPQVSDPRAPEWADAVKAHLSWWDAIVAAAKQRGERLTVLTEAGPPDYMPTMPYSRKPLADQWAVNVHMMQLLRKRYASPNM